MIRYRVTWFTCFTFRREYTDYVTLEGAQRAYTLLGRLPYARPTLGPIYRPDRLPIERY